MGGEMMWWAKSVTQPSAEISVSEYQLINHKIKYPGIVTWNDIDITLVDVGDKGQRLLFDLESYGYDFRDTLKDGVSKIKADVGTPRELFQLLIIKYDDEGDIIETWTLINPFFKAIKYGDLDYSSDELLEVTLTVAYDSATLT